MNTVMSKSLEAITAGVAALGIAISAQAGLINTYLMSIGVNTPSAVSRAGSAAAAWAPSAAIGQR